MRSPLLLAMCGAAVSGCAFDAAQVGDTAGDTPDDMPGDMSGDEIADPANDIDDTSAFTSGTIQINLLYVHGVNNDANGRSNAHNSLSDLKAAVAAELPSRIASYQASHPGVTVTFASASANLYTARPSPFHPSDSTNPTLMDDVTDITVVIEPKGSTPAIQSLALLHDAPHASQIPWQHATQASPELQASSQRHSDHEQFVVSQTHAPPPSSCTTFEVCSTPGVSSEDDPEDDCVEQATARPIASHAASMICFMVSSLFLG